MGRSFEIHCADFRSRWQNKYVPRIHTATLAEHRDWRRSQLIEAAAAIALESGSQAITVAAVAERAGQGRGGHPQEHRRGGRPHHPPGGRLRGRPGVHRG